MKIEVFEDTAAVAQEGARVIVEAARQAVAQRGRFVMAISGGRTPWQMLRLLAEEEMPWPHVHIVQVDERIAQAGSEERNLTHLRESLLSHADLPPENIHAMPVEAEDLPAAAAQYAATLKAIAGTPPILDLVHLGLGADGHTASLVPGDAVLEETAADVALTEGEYQGRRRMTLTYPTLDRARQIVWLVTGGDKQQAFRQLCQGDAAIPAGRVSQTRALLLADRAAAGDAANRSD